MDRLKHATSGFFLAEGSFFSVAIDVNRNVFGLSGDESAECNNLAPGSGNVVLNFIRW